jgi:hypothetical protein
MIGIIIIIMVAIITIFVTIVILTLHFLLTFPETKSTVAPLWMLLVSLYPLSKLETFPPSTSVMSQHSALEQGAARL